MSMRNELAIIADPAYLEFQAKLVPTVAPERILGVRIPELRRFARTLWKDRPAEARAFLNEPLPHETYDEMNLHGLLIGMAAQTPSEAIDLLDRFLSHVDNWATSDLIRVPAFKRDLPAALVQLRAWMQATGPHTEYVVRFGVTQLMELFLGDDFAPEQLTWVAAIERPEYYINMARAWYFSYALIKQPAATLPLFEQRSAQGEPMLDPWTHNKSLQKARESRRMSPEQKAYLQSLKV
ncbi:DNA alkylation repair protein [Enorma massiliensis]|uniref:DNA alkylation repair protein n=1 Tax=Enorma massiliensis TaxID=1472761 RepID=UPI00195823CA|nr:DNA alkylation repair protein [Enorma massiliensis]MBM6892749.1 DNA alkylation repair protein [Enorma massiliensis]